MNSQNFFTLTRFAVLFHISNVTEELIWRKFLNVIAFHCNIYIQFIHFVLFCVILEWVGWWGRILLQNRLICRVIFTGKCNHISIPHSCYGHTYWQIRTMKRAWILMTTLHTTSNRTASTDATFHMWPQQMFFSKNV